MFFNEDEYEEIKDESILKFTKKLIGGQEMIKGQNKYALWIKDEDLEEALKNQLISEK